MHRESLSFWKWSNVRAKPIDRVTKYLRSKQRDSGHDTSMEKVKRPCPSHHWQCGLRWTMHVVCLSTIGHDSCNSLERVPKEEDVVARTTKANGSKKVKWPTSLDSQAGAINVNRKKYWTAIESIDRFDRTFNNHRCLTINDHATAPTLVHVSCWCAKRKEKRNRGLDQIREFERTASNPTGRLNHNSNWFPNH